MDKKIIKDIVDEYGIKDLNYKLMNFKPKQKILGINDRINFLYIAVQGSAEICMYSFEGKSLNIFQINNSGTIGDLELMTKLDKSSADIYAITDFTVIIIPFSECKKELENNIKFLNKMGEELGKKLLRSTHNYCGATMLSGKQRIAQRLLEIEKNSFLTIKITDLSKIVGISYRQTQRIINDFEKENIIKRNKKDIFINDKEKLLKILK